MEEEEEKESKRKVSERYFLDAFVRCSIIGMGDFL